MDNIQFNDWKELFTWLSLGKPLYSREVEFKANDRDFPLGMTVYESVVNKYTVGGTDKGYYKDYTPNYYNQLSLNKSLLSFFKEDPRENK